MVIGINAAAALKEPRTGVEEYTYQIIKHLTMLKQAEKHRFVLYSPQNLKWPFPMWTQLRLAAEMVFNKPDALFIPVHILPLIHPKNSVVTIHGLEYEYYPEMYPPQHLRYLRWSTKYALKKARRIIAVSENTKKDLVEIYGGPAEKIDVVYHGMEIPKHKTQNTNKTQNLKLESCILFIGRLELKKNILGILEAYKILKQRYQVPHRLVLAGPPGYGYDRIKFKVQSSKFKVIETGYLAEAEKWQLLSQAELFLFPSFYEGFGIPIIEAQAAGCPVITANVSSMPEVAGPAAILVDPKDPEQISRAIYRIIEDKDLRRRLIRQGYQNVKRFSWQKCAQETLRVLTE